MTYFVDKTSIVRQIWGKSDTILLIFAGAAAEFALSKAVDWLFFTGRLPGDPIGRLLSTVSYARTIVFSDEDTAHRAIDAITAIHAGVEIKRGAHIPAWAYRDVLFMLIDYSIRSFELLERKMSTNEKQEVFDVFYRMGSRMGIADLPENYNDWRIMRHENLNQNLQCSHFTTDLFRQYRKHLGRLRYHLLLEVQVLLVPQTVRDLLGYRNNSYLKPLLGIYNFIRILNLDLVLKNLILPSVYKNAFEKLDMKPR